MIFPIARILSRGYNYYSMDISDKIIYLRKKRKLSQSQLAGKIGVSTKLVADWEKAAVRPDTECIRRLSKEFEISRADLMNDDVDLKNNPLKELIKTLNFVASKKNKEMLITAIAFLVVAFIFVLTAIGLKSILYSIFAMICAFFAIVAFVLREKNKK